MTFVLLLDKKAPATSDVQDWLSKNGLVSWLANDVSHAIEELSDFTVRNRPDVVLLEVAFLSESFDALRSTLKMSSEAGDITVLGLEGGASSDQKFFARIFDELSAMSLLKSGPSHN